MKKRFATICLSLIMGSSFAQITVEAETGVLTGTQVETSVAGYSGSGYVNGFDQDNDEVTVSFTVPATGTYSLSVRYQADSYKEQFLYVNGASVGKLITPQATSWTTIDAGGLFLYQGTNTVTVEKEWGWILLDNMALTAVPPHDYNVTASLIDPLADQNTVAVWEYLKANFGQKVISGQTAYYEELAAIAGKYPKQRAFDFQSYTQGYAYDWDNGHVFGWVENGTTQSIIDWYESTNGCGLVSVQWHWHSPSGGSPGTNTFYTDHTSFDVRNAVDPTKAEYDLIIEDIDSAATQLKKLQAAGIPVLWRPLHEAGGGWFWWGAHGSGPALQLWDILQDRLMNHHNLHNLIWVWSTPEEDWYPGHGKVDVIGYDSYPGAYNYTTQKTMFDHLYDLVEGNKIVAMTENGPIPDIDQLMEQDAMWSYFSSWNDLVASQNSTQHIQDVFANSLVVTLDDPCGIITSNDPAVSGAESFMLYPNPTTGLINLPASSPWSVSNSLGSEVLTGEGDLINLSDMETGVYFIRIENEVYKVQKF